MKQKIIDLAKDNFADIVGFAPASRFPEDDPIFKIFPNVKTVIGLGFRVLRGIYRGTEEGTTYYQYTTMAVENMEETIMTMASLKVCNLIEGNGFIAVPQRRHEQIMAEDNSTNPEVAYDSIYRRKTSENQMNFVDSAVKCGLGEKGLSGALLTDDFGPFVRYCFVLTDMEIESDELQNAHLCDKCGECIKACPGNAISEDGLNTWQCAVYYKGAHKSNPFITEDFLKGDPEREKILNGEKRFDSDSAREIFKKMNFLPNTQWGYAPCLCGKKCDVACFKHIKGEY